MVKLMSVWSVEKSSWFSGVQQEHWFLSFITNVVRFRQALVGGIFGCSIETVTIVVGEFVLRKWLLARDLSFAQYKIKLFFDIEMRDN